MQDLEKKIALVTGGSGGIGRAIASRFADCGARVALHYHNGRERAEETLAVLPGDGHAVFQADLTNPDSAAEIVAATVALMGRIDILVNNAGIYELHPFDKLSYDDWISVWHQTVTTNLFGPAYLSYCVAGQMQKQSGGKIINITSRGAFRGEPDAPAYAASKAGLNAMSQSLAKTLAVHNIYVYAIAPGFVDTERVAPILDGPLGSEIRHQSPLGRVARPEEVAHTAVFLAAEGSEFLTGCIVDVNGASYLRS